MREDFGCYLLCCAQHQISMGPMLVKSTDLSPKSRMQCFSCGQHLSPREQAMVKRYSANTKFQPANAFESKSLAKSILKGGAHFMAGVEGEAVGHGLAIDLPRISLLIFLTEPLNSDAHSGNKSSFSSFCLEFRRLGKRTEDESNQAHASHLFFSSQGETGTEVDLKIRLRSLMMMDTVTKTYCC